MNELEVIYARYSHAMATFDWTGVEGIVQEVSQLPGPEAAAMTDLLRAGLLNVSDAYAEGVEAATAAKRQYKDLGDDRGVIRSNIQIMMNSQALGDYTRSLELCHEILHLNETVQEPNIEGGTLNTIGLMYRETGDYPAAIEYLEKALAIFTKQGNRAFIANATCNIGGIYFYLDRFEDALRFLEEGVAMQREVGNVEYEIGQSLAIAKTLISLDRIDEGERLMTEMYDRSVELGKPSLIAPAVMDLARHAVHQGRFDEALELLESKREIIDTTAAWTLERDTVYGTALANLKQYDQAKSVLNAAIDLATTLNFKAHIQNYHRILRDVAKSEGDFDAYVKHNDVQQKLNDELKGAETARKLALAESERKIADLNQERERERAVLYSTLPKHVADRIIRGEEVSDRIDHAVVLFADIVGFTTHSSTMDPSETTSLLATVFDRYDEICRTNNVTKIKTIGDSYMAVAFPDATEPESVGELERRAASVSTEMIAQQITWPDGSPLSIRIGIHSGPVAAGVVGKERLQYDVWGDTVNTASRMESTGEPGRIQCSEVFVGSLTSFRDDAASPLTLERGASEGGGVRFRTTERGSIDIKGKGTMTTYWLE